MVKEGKGALKGNTFFCVTCKLSFDILTSIEEEYLNPRLILLKPIEAMSKCFKSAPELHHHPTLWGNMDIRHSLPHAYLAGECGGNLD